MLWVGSRMEALGQLPSGSHSAAKLYFKLSMLLLHKTNVTMATTRIWLMTVDLNFKKCVISSIGMVFHSKSMVFVLHGALEGYTILYYVQCLVYYMGLYMQSCMTTLSWWCGWCEFKRYLTLCVGVSYWDDRCKCMTKVCYPILVWVDFMLDLSLYVHKHSTNLFLVTTFN